MKAYSLIKETVLRKTSIRVVHLSWFAVYPAIFLIPWPPETWQWGPFLFGWSGCLLPLLLSEGIFGDDIASGRIRTLVTEPIRPTELYLYRFLGLSLQAAAHFLAVGVSIWLLYRLTGRGSIGHFALWVLASWLVFNTWAALSTSLSVVLKRSNNSMLLFLATVIAFVLLNLLTQFFPQSMVVEAIRQTVRYVGPPVEFLGQTALGKFSLLQGVGCVVHSLLLAALYGTAGIILLGRREFKYVAD